MLQPSSSFVVVVVVGLLPGKVTPKAAAMGLKEGDRVAYNSFFSYAEYTAVPAAKLLPVPDAVPLDVATALVVQVPLPIRAGTRQKESPTTAAPLPPFTRDHHHHHHHPPRLESPLSVLPLRVL